MPLALSKKEVRLAMALVGAAFLLSLSYSFYFKIRPAVDAAAYDNIAWNLVEGRGYKENAELFYEKDIAILRVGPGYQFFLAGIYFIFGRNYEAVWIINALLHALTALFAYFLSREVFGTNWTPWIGWVSAALIGFSPDLITMSGMLMTETLAVFLVTLTAFLFFKYINNFSRPLYLAVLLGAVFGFAVLVRTPVALMTLPIFYYFFEKKQWAQFLVFVVILIAVFTPWTIRNYKTYGAFIPTNYAFGYDLLIGNHQGASGELEEYEAARRYVYEYEKVPGNKLALKEALRFIVFNPLEFLKITLKRISIYFSFVRPTGFWFHLKGTSRATTLALSALYSALIFGLAFWGIYKIRELSGEEKEKAKRLFWLTVTAPLAVIFIVVETRYRFLAYPLLSVLAGFGLYDLFKQKTDFKALFAIWGVLLFNSAIDGTHNLDRVLERIKEIL